MCWSATARQDDKAALRGLLAEAKRFLSLSEAVLVSLAGGNTSHAVVEQARFYLQTGQSRLQQYVNSLTALVNKRQVASTSAASLLDQATALITQLDTALTNL